MTCCWAPGLVMSSMYSSTLTTPIKSKMRPRSVVRMVGAPCPAVKSITLLVDRRLSKSRPSSPVALSRPMYEALWRPAAVVTARYSSSGVLYTCGRAERCRTMIISILPKCKRRRLYR